MVQMNIKKTVQVDIKTISLEIKICDRFACTFRNQQNENVGDYQGYVPGFFPGDHYGDYLYLEIDIENGKILNWNAPTEENIQELLECNEE